MSDEREKIATALHKIYVPGCTQCSYTDKDWYAAKLVLDTRTASAQVLELRACIEELARQFGGWHSVKGGYTTNGLSALEGAFELLGWDDPHIDKGSRCDEPGCKKQISCGWPDGKGKYRRTCGEHWKT